MNKRPKSREETPKEGSDGARRHRCKLSRYEKSLFNTSDSAWRRRFARCLLSVMRTTLLAEDRRSLHQRLDLRAKRLPSRLAGIEHVAAGIDDQLDAGGAGKSRQLVEEDLGGKIRRGEIKQTVTD